MFSLFVYCMYFIYIGYNKLVFDSRNYIWFVIINYLFVLKKLLKDNVKLWL